MGVAWGAVKLEAVHGYFSQVYALQLQMEREGDTLPSLEARLTICKDTGTMGRRLKRSIEGLADEYRSIILSSSAGR